MRLSELLTHLYVLLPVLDDEKHYWVDDSEVEKLQRRGADWLPAHPERGLIARRYLKHERRLYNPLLASFDEQEPASPREEALEERVSLRDQRLGTVQAVLQASGARRVLDLGCGPGALLERLVRDGYEQITGVDVSARALEQAARRLRLDRLPGPRADRAPAQPADLPRHGASQGYDAAALVEVDRALRPAAAGGASRPTSSARRGRRCVVVTTPNAEYNRMWETLPAGELRHPDHRFEWTRAEFAAWASRVGGAYGYSVRFLPVGPEDAEVGPPTQMAVFER